MSSQTHPTTDGTAAAASGGLAAFPEQWREELRENLFQRLIARDALFPDAFFTEIWRRPELPRSILNHPKKWQAELTKKRAEMTAITRGGTKKDRETLGRAKIILELLKAQEEAENALAQNHLPEVVAAALKMGRQLELLAQRNQKSSERRVGRLPEFFSLLDEAFETWKANPKRGTKFDSDAEMHNCEALRQAQPATLQNHLSRWRRWQRRKAELAGDEEFKDDREKAYALAAPLKSPK